MRPTHWLPAALTAAALMLSAEAAAQDGQLGEAPRRDEPQDASTWSHERMPKAARTRAQVVTLYKTVYVPGNSVALTWTGSVTNCDPGATNADHRQAVIARVGYNPGARVMEITFDPPLERFRLVEVRLKDGIVGTDGASLKPWTLTFTTGGS